MPNSLIPKELRLAAKRGLVRTSFQAYAATLTASVPSAATLLGIIGDRSQWALALTTLAIAVVSPILAGLASYLSIISNGLPQEYRDATVEEIESEGGQVVVYPVDEA